MTNDMGFLDKAKECEAEIEKLEKEKQEMISKAEGKCEAKSQEVTAK